MNDSLNQFFSFLVENPFKPPTVHNCTLQKNFQKPTIQKKYFTRTNFKNKVKCTVVYNWVKTS